jgi:4-diphosphocytidyl-2-C-methyl-D-erythritol kinase
MGLITEIAFAKINLALHVRSRRPDGYHELETLFAFAIDGDVLSGQENKQISLSIHGPFGADLVPDEDNLVLRAAHALQEAFAVESGAALVLDKRLPLAAGIGGGSADAAATLRLLVRLWRLDPDDLRIVDIAKGLGADVPACLASCTMRGEGVGEKLTVVDDSAIANMALLLVNPLKPCPTGPVFQAWDGVDRGELANSDPLAAALSGRNDLERPARGLIPEIDDVIQGFSGLEGVILSRMSGSGATCFALFDSLEARDRAALTFPDCWTLATQIRSAGS